ncbi:MAG: AAA family ATPase, partial [Candidatus Ryanbacteria bacterium]|nr:AAA family ATPase [Candidatus Ryanbacteria bacterium]
MYLKSLTLTGFKSFGKTTLFEFPTSITAIVGPNGSGKSNVAESIRWVLGEQSMKSLRGKKGEDLIFHGSEKVARLARAEVKLIFDNSAKQLPFEFDDVIISRRVMRDGTNEYLLNGSHVRLKDIFEILSKVGLGITQHHIISQGEVDRILWTSPFERQEMVEDALGLREFHMKAKETLRKLEETGINMKQVEAQRREIQPHLKYLRLQAEKMKAHKKYALDLEEKSQEYLAREGSTLANLKKESHIKREPLMAEEHEYQKKIKALQEEIRHGEKEFSRVPGRDAVRKEIDELEEQRRMLEREFGKIEGLLLAHASSDSDISPTMIAGDIREAILYVDELLGKDSFESLKSGLKDVKVRLESLLRTLTGEKKSERSGELAGKKENILGELRVIELKIQDMKDKREEENIVREDIMVDLREREHEIRNLERELEGVRGRLREIEFSNEQYKSREAEFQKFLQEFGIEKHGSGDLFANDAERATLLRAIDRLRLKLEEAGGIDGSVIKEYDTTLERDEFLGRELGDLEKARKSLETLMRELEETLKERFINGLKKINHEFQEIFKTVF